MSTIILVNTNLSATSNSAGYFLAAILAFLIMGYLVFSLIKPEKF
jgi:K+-transporting ATPase KdpF subunit